MDPLIIQGRVVQRTDPANAKLEDFPDMVGLPEGKAEKKMEEIRRGGELVAEFPPLPQTRECQDVLWLGFFLLTVAVTLGYGWASSGPLLEQMEKAQKTNMDVDDGDIKIPSFSSFVTMATAAGVGAIAACIAYFFMMRQAPKCMVWTSLVFGPVMTMIIGLCLILTGDGFAMLLGLVFVAVGVCMLACTCCCWAHLVPFMVKLTEVVATVISHHPCMITVGIIGTVLAISWTLAAGISFISIYLSNREALAGVEQHNNILRYFAVFVCSLIFIWGAGVVNNVCHVTYCGIFGYWYYGTRDGYHSAGSEDDPSEGKLGPAFQAAVTSSLGSICLGSFLVAIVRAAEMAANMMKQDAQEDGNYFLCVIACAIEMIISCIGDILEYFNDWAYVQCAVRGCSFCEAARITYSMMTCANMKYILSDLLLNSLISMGSMVIGIVAMLFAATAGFSIDGWTGAGWGAALGFVIGVIAGGAALGTINSGIKTILACWADDPMKLMESHPEIHEEFQQRLGNNIGAAWGK